MHHLHLVIQSYNKNLVTMLLSKNSVQESHYDILSVEEDASYEDIRTSYRVALLNFHPDKLRDMGTSGSDNELGDRFLKVQKAWEILSSSGSRAVYDNELRASRQDTAVAEDVSLGDMTVEDVGEDVQVLELSYQCRCGDHFSIDSLELEELGYRFTSNGKGISVKTPDAVPASVVLPCGSCSLKVRLLINGNIEVPTGDNL